MASVGSTQDSNRYESERLAQESVDRTFDKARDDDEKELAYVKEEYQTKIKDLKNQANEDVRRLKEDMYDSQGRKLSSMERDQLTEKKRIVHAYETALTKSDDKQQDLKKHYEARLSTALTDAHEQATRQMEAQQLEYSKMAQDRAVDSSVDKKSLADELAYEKHHNMQTTEHLVTLNDRDRENALAARSQVYDDYLKESHRNQRYAISQKDQEINDLRSTTDPFKISPEARRKIEDQYQSQFSKSLAVEKDVSDKNVDALKVQNQNFQQSSREAYQEKFAELSKNLRQNSALNNHGIAQGYAELKANSEMMKDNYEQKQKNQSARAYQQSTSQLEMQQKRSNEQLKVQQESLTDQRYKEMDTLEMKQRDQDRDWTFKLNDTRRGYEKKLTDQQDYHERAFSEAKFEFDKKLQEHDRQAKSLLDEFTKGHESQLKQQEEVFKQKERFLTEHFEEELDKVKRNNARNSEKKS